MIKKRSQYISYRIAIIFLAITVLIFIMLLLLSIIAIREHNYGVGLIFCYISLVCILYTGYRWISKPYKETDKAYRLFAEGLILQGIFELRCPISPQINKATMRFKDMLDTKELISISKKQAEYLALQNQINPHFLYNTLEGIRSEAMCAGMDGVAQMTETLAKFFRYTISNVDNLVTLEDELSNIENYYSIQQYRFGDRLRVHIEYGEEDEKDVLMFRLPKLTLQPIVENSIYHGIERKIGIGNLRIKIQTTSKRLIITISDDGLGMNEEQLKILNKKLREISLDGVAPESNKLGGIAIMNVNNRIKLLFGEEYGIYIYSTLNVGTDVIITLPKIKV